MSRVDGQCDFNRFHPSEPRCQRTAEYAWDKGPDAFTRETTWCKEHSHANDSRMKEPSDADR